MYLCSVTQVCMSYIHKCVTLLDVHLVNYRMADRTCARCGKCFRDPSTLKRHETKKLPCDIVVVKTNNVFACEYCNRSFASADSRGRHVRQYCKAPKLQTNGLQIMQDKIAEIERKLSERQSVPPITTIQSNTLINAPTSFNIGSVVIQPWGAPLQLTDADVEAALATVPGIAGTPALPEVVAALMELVKRAHVPPAARNVHLNPKRTDQALALTPGGWAALPLEEATAALFDGASASIAAARMPSVRQMMRATLPVQYRAERAASVQMGLRPMGAHLLNVMPGGPGPLLLETPAPAACPKTAAPAQRPAPTTVERVKAVLKTHPIRCGPSGALLVDWIVAASQAAELSGQELFKALQICHDKTLEPDGAFEAAQAAAKLYSAEKAQPRLTTKM